VATEVHERIGDAVSDEIFARTVERVAFGVAAEIELYRRIGATHDVVADLQIAHARMRGYDFLDLAGVGYRATGLIAMKAPERDQAADRWIERFIGTLGKRLRCADEAGDFRSGTNASIACGDRAIQIGQCARLPRVQVTMHAVELAKQRRGCFSCAGFGFADEGYRSDRAEYVGAGGELRSARRTGQNQRQ